LSEDIKVLDFPEFVPLKADVFLNEMKWIGISRKERGLNGGEE